MRHQFKFVNISHLTSYLNKEEAATLRKWRQDPANWSPK